MAASLTRSWITCDDYLLTTEAAFSVEAVLSLHDVDAFEQRVSAYPAITVVRNAAQGPAVAATATAQFNESTAADFGSWLRNRAAPHRNECFTAVELPQWFSAGGGLWPSGDPEQLGLLEELNERFAPLESPHTRTRVGIGIATGNDAVYVTRDAEVVEPDRLLPLVMRNDIQHGAVTQPKQYLVNPWSSNGTLVDLAAYPRLAKYFAGHQELLRRRHIGKKMPDRWYRTIDKVDERLIGRRKLLFPDMARRAHPTLEDGALYPHHNLYWVTSDAWDLKVLGGLLLSRVADLFVGAYCVRMRGGTMRFQAQYLRQIRVPPVEAISPTLAAGLAEAFERRDVDRATDLAAVAYGIEHHRELLDRIVVSMGSERTTVAVPSNA